MSPLGGELAAVSVPLEVERFVEPKTTPILLKAGDLLGGHRPGFALVLDKGPGFPRILVLLAREGDGALYTAARNDHLIQCGGCGGAIGGAGFATVPGGFIVTNSHGDAPLLESTRCRFAYSKALKTWQLVEAISDTAERDHSSIHRTHAIAPLAKLEGITLLDPGQDVAAVCGVSQL